MHGVSSLYLSTRFVARLFESIMPRLSLEARRRVVTLFENGVSVRDIQKRLEEDNFVVTKQTLYRLIQKFKRDGVIVDLPRRK